MQRRLNELAEQERVNEARRLAALKASDSVLVTINANPTAAVMQQTRECSVCIEDTRIIDGIACHPTGRHFMCDVCFAQHVKIESQKPLESLRKRGARVACGLCAQAGVGEPYYTPHSIALHAPTQFAAYQKALLALKETEVIEVVQQQHERELKALRELQQVADRARQVRDACEHVRQSILTLRCPNDVCRAAFDSFVDCFALHCTRCKTAFCAWCLADCRNDDNNDAHRHVANCADNLLNRSVFGTAGLILNCIDFLVKFNVNFRKHTHICVG